MKIKPYTVIGLTAIFILLGCGSSEQSDRCLKAASIENIHGKQTAQSFNFRNLIRFYSVRPGDTLCGIAQTHGTTTVSLKKANNLEDSIIRPGQQIFVPLFQDSSTGPPTAPANSALREGIVIQSPPLRFRLVKTGIGMLGIRYKRGGSAENGFDCSGLVKNLFSKFDIELPRNSRQQYREGKTVSRDELETGDLVFFSSGGKQPNHVGVYIGGNKFLHAALKARKVIISDLNKNWYAVRFLGGRRIMALWKEEPVPETKEANFFRSPPSIPNPFETHGFIINIQGSDFRRQTRLFPESVHIRRPFAGG